MYRVQASACTLFAFLPVKFDLIPGTLTAADEKYKRNGETYEILQWQTVSSAQWNEQDGPKVWDADSIVG